MNEIFNYGETVVHDDREFITPEEAFDILYYQGKSIMICDPDDLTEDPPRFNMPFPLWLCDIGPANDWFEKLTDGQIRDAVFDYLRGYELSR